MRGGGRRSGRGRSQEWSECQRGDSSSSSFVFAQTSKRSLPPLFLPICDSLLSSVPTRWALLATQLAFVCGERRDLYHMYSPITNAPIAEPTATVTLPALRHPPQ